MRLDLFFTILAIPAAICAMMLGDSLNLFFKASAEAENVGAMFPIIVCGICMAVCGLAVYSYITEYYEVTNDSREQIEKGAAVVVAAFAGFIAFAIFVGPINNGGKAWFDGWSFIAIIACLPAILNLNTLAQQTVQDFKDRKAEARREGDVVQMRSGK